jgi:site-specific recombinase XerD
VLLHTALRLGELAALSLDDVRLSARKGILMVRRGKGEAHREVHLSGDARAALEGSLCERRERFPEASQAALFLNRTGGRLSPRSIDEALRRIGWAAELALSAHVLRHTRLTNLVRRGNDIVLVAEIAGHQRPQTTRRYFVGRR